jgi:metal-responsive CopG/Arc/MetJ family transcriptional regulator
MKEQNKNKVNTGFTLNNDIVKLMDELLDDIGNTNRSRYIEKLIREDFDKRGIKIEKKF